jgi:hypothetical protein
MGSKIANPKKEKEKLRSTSSPMSFSAADSFFNFPAAIRYTVGRIKGHIDRNIRLGLSVNENPG